VKNFRDLLRLLHVARCRLCVAYHLQDLERAKVGLARSFAAPDAAEADLAIHDQQERSSDAPPMYLLKETK